MEPHKYVPGLMFQTCGWRVDAIMMVDTCNASMAFADEERFAFSRVCVTDCMGYTDQVGLRYIFLPLTFRHQRCLKEPCFVVYFAS